VLSTLPEDLASIENQAQDCKIWVEIGDFDRWCPMLASELVISHTTARYADTTFLYYEELISADERLCRCSQFKISIRWIQVRFSTFEPCAHTVVANLKFAIPISAYTLSPLYPLTMTLRCIRCI